MVDKNLSARLAASIAFAFASLTSVSVGAEVTFVDKSVNMTYHCPGIIAIYGWNHARVLLRKMILTHNSINATFEVGRSIGAMSWAASKHLTNNVVGLAYSLDGGPLVAVRPSPGIEDYEMQLYFERLPVGPHKLLVAPFPFEQHPRDYDRQTIDGLVVGRPETYCIRLR